MLDVSIVIVSFNTREILRRGLQSGLDHSGEVAYEIIVIGPSPAFRTIDPPIAATWRPKKPAAAFCVPMIRFPPYVTAPPPAPFANARQKGRPAHCARRPAVRAPSAAFTPTSIAWLAGRDHCFGVWGRRGHC